MVALMFRLQSPARRQSAGPRRHPRTNAALRAAVACYSVEGVYPDNVEYLVEHYGLRYDTETFILQYDAFAENILPDIRVLVRGAE